MKLVSSLLVIVHIAAAAEAMVLGLKAGVDLDMWVPDPGWSGNNSGYANVVTYVVEPLGEGVPG